MSIEDKRDQLVEELIPFEDHLERLTYVIDRAKDNPGLEAEYKIDTFLIKGCVSWLWIFPSFHDGKCFFQADSQKLHYRGNSQPTLRSLQWRKSCRYRSARARFLIGGGYHAAFVSPTEETDSPEFVKR